MDNINLKEQHKKKISSSSSSLNIKSRQKKPLSNFVFLVNTLSSDIKSFYQSIKYFLVQGQQSVYQNKNSSKQIFDLIDQNLNEFINKAKEIFKRMRYIQKINLIQQEINSYQPQIKSNQNTDSAYLTSNYENYINKSNNILNTKKITDEEVYIPNIYNNTSSSINIINYIKNMKLKQNFNDEYNNNKSLNEKYLYRNNNSRMIKSMNTSSKDLKLINKYDDYSFNEPSEKYQKHHSVKKILYNNIKRPNNNNKNKTVINLRKKILFDHNKDNSLFNDISSNNINSISTSITKNNIFRNKKQIFENINVIISLLKEIKFIKGNIFIKSLEAEKHKKLLKKIYDELLKLIKNIFKVNNMNMNINKNNNLDIQILDDKIKNNSSNDLSYINHNINNIFNNENNNNNIRTDYNNKEIRHRDLIIEQLKEELNSKINKKYSKNISMNNSYEKEKSKKIIDELQKKIEKSEKKIKNNEIITKKYIELQKEKENIILINQELKNKIILLEQQIDNFTQKISIEAKFQALISQNFSFNFPSEKEIGDKAQKIIEELNLVISTKNENLEKVNSELNILKEMENKEKEEILKLNEENNKYKEEISKIQKELENMNKKNEENNKELITLKEDIENKSNIIEKFKKMVSYQEEEISNLKNNSSSKKEKNSNKDNINSINNIYNDDKKNKKRNNNTKANEIQIEQDKIYLKYELLKNDYDKLNSTLQQKQKLLDNYSKISSETASKTNIDEQILELMAEHKKEIEALTKKYNKNIINLKMNQPSPYSPATHTILIDKRYSKYDLKWYLLTILTEEEKNYENTFWVSEQEMRPILNQFGKFKTEKELEDEKFDNLYKMQEKWIKQIDDKEKVIEMLKNKLEEYENSPSQT